ncbi:MAG: Uma2 family endonuclease [Bacteroidota bacterium]
MGNEVKEPAFKYNYISPAEYLAAERVAAIKHEYYDGQVLAMSGAGVKHNIIASNLVGAVSSFLQGKDCRILFSEMRVGTLQQDAYMYPDALIVCGELQLEDKVFDTLLNPSVIFEILSPATMSIDKGRKLFFYQGIPSLQEYIMIDSLRKFIHLARKQDNGHWIFENISDPAASLFIRTINGHFPLAEIYSDTGL